MIFSERLELLESRKRTNLVIIQPAEKKCKIISPGETDFSFDALHNSLISGLKQFNQKGR